MQILTDWVVDSRRGETFIIARLPCGTLGSGLSIDAVKFKVREQLKPDARRLGILVMDGDPDAFQGLYGTPEQVAWVRANAKNISQHIWTPLNLT